MGIGETAWRLLTWEVGTRARTGQLHVGYRLTSPQGEAIFEGEDFGCAPSDAIDSDACLRGILGFLTLRPGDTDAEYFESFTPAQLAFAANDAEDLSQYATDPEDSEDPEEAREFLAFVDVPHNADAPDNDTPDFERPSGWCGDSSRGAGMGRSSDLPHDTASKCHLQRVRLDEGGYDKGGAYWGAPSNLWLVRSVETETDAEKLAYVRAPNRDAAKSKFPNARWFR